jgi:uncharacterized repeat protein (TIGR01451 family)
LDVELGDLDGDDDLDALVTNIGYSDLGAQTVWLNDGIGNYSPHPATPRFGEDNSDGGALGDLDGDGDLDLVVANFDSAFVWLNNGVGSFSRHPTTPSFGPWGSLDVALGDLDGDDDLDAVVANHGTSGNSDTVWLNDGAGNFTPHPITPAFGTSHGNDVALGDLDGDGDLDAVVANGDFDNPDEPQTVWLNRNRKVDLWIAKLATPAVVTPGEAITFTLVYSNTGLDVATGAVITDLVPVSVTIDTIVSSGVAITPTGTISYAWQVQDLAPGQGGVITLSGVISSGLPAGAVFTNTAIIAAGIWGDVATATVMTQDEPISGLEAINDSHTVLGQATTLTATIAAGTNVSYHWGFGDGEFGAGAVVVHTYPAAGLYTAVVTATNSVTEHTATTTVTVKHRVYLPLLLRND